MRATWERPTAPSTPWPTAWDCASPPSTWPARPGGCRRACGAARAPNSSPGTEFKPGHKTWNAGKKGWSPPGSERGHFKPGHRPHTWCPIGTLRLPAKGYLQIKLTDTGNTLRDFVPIHRLMWEQVHGQPVPEGHAVTFRDGNILHLSPANLELKSRAEVMAGNSIHARLPPEVVDLERLRWALNRRIKKATER